MNAADRNRAQRTALWALPIMDGAPDVSPHHERDAALAQLVGTPGWEAAKSLLTEDLKHARIDFSDPQWAGKTAYRNGRCDRALDLIKAVESAPAKVQARAIETPVEPA